MTLPNLLCDTYRKLTQYDDSADTVSTRHKLFLLINLLNNVVIISPSLGM